MLNSVTGSITISSVSTDPFMSATLAQGEPALIYELKRVPVMDLPFLVFNGKGQSSSTVPGSVLEDVWPSGYPHEVFFIVWSKTLI